jgi:hypothetical protein
MKTQFSRQELRLKMDACQLYLMKETFVPVQKSIPRSTCVAFHAIYYLKSSNLCQHHSQRLV